MLLAKALDLRHISCCPSNLFLCGGKITWATQLHSLIWGSKDTVIWVSCLVMRNVFVFAKQQTSLKLSALYLVRMGQDGVDLEWKMYENISRNSFRTLYSDTDFTDVTLACEDNKKVMAHKVVLSRFIFCFFLLHIWALLNVEQVQWDVEDDLGGQPSSSSTYLSPGRLKEYCAYFASFQYFAYVAFFPKDASTLF